MQADMAGVSDALIRRCLKEEPQAQSELYRACFGFLMPVCARYAPSRDDAMEYLNLGFYKLLSNLKKYQPPAPFEAWAKRVVIHTIIDTWRRSRHRRQELSMEEHPPPESADGELPGSAQQLISAEDAFLFIRQLPPMTAAVFNLFAMDGYPHKDIAALFGISEGTSKWHYAEARKRLKIMVLEKINAAQLTHPLSS